MSTAATISPSVLESLSQEFALWERDFRQLVKDQALWKDGFVESRRALSRLNKKRRSLGPSRPPLPRHLGTLMAQFAKVETVDDEPARKACSRYLDEIPITSALWHPPSAAVPAPSAAPDHPSPAGVPATDTPSVPPPSLTHAVPKASVPPVASRHETPSQRNTDSHVHDDAPQDSLHARPDSRTAPSTSSVLTLPPPASLTTTEMNTGASRRSTRAAPSDRRSHPSPIIATPVESRSIVASKPFAPPESRSADVAPTSSTNKLRIPPIATIPPSKADDEDVEMKAVGPFVLGSRRMSKDSTLEGPIPPAPKPSVSFREIEESSLTHSDYEPDSPSSGNDSTSAPPKSRVDKGKQRQRPMKDVPPPPKKMGKHPSPEPTLKYEPRKEKKKKTPSGPRRRKNVSRDDGHALDGPFDTPCARCDRLDQAEKCIRFEGDDRLACTECYYNKLKCSHAPTPAQRKALKIKIKRPSKNAHAGEDRSDDDRQEGSSSRPSEGPMRPLLEKLSEWERKFDQLVAHFSPGGPAEYLSERLRKLETLEPRLAKLETFAKSVQGDVRKLLVDMSRQQSYNISSEKWLHTHVPGAPPHRLEDVNNVSTTLSTTSLEHSVPPPPVTDPAVHVTPSVHAPSVPLPSVPSFGPMECSSPSVPLTPQVSAGATERPASPRPTDAGNLNLMPPVSGALQPLFLPTDSDEGSYLQFSDSSDGGTLKRKIDDVDDSMVIDDRDAKKTKF